MALTYITGSGGNDTLAGAGGLDTIRALAGDDTIVLSNADWDQINTGPQYL